MSDTSAKYPRLYCIGLFMIWYFSTSFLLSYNLYIPTENQEIWIYETQTNKQKTNKNKTTKELKLINFDKRW